MTIKKILFPTDFSKVSQKAHDLAKDLKTRLEAEVHVLNVYDGETMDLALPYGQEPASATGAPEHDVQMYDHAKKMLDTTCEALGATEGHFVEGEAGPQIVRFAKENNFDMIIIGTHGYKGLQRMLMGSVAEHVLRHSDLPVLTIKGE